MQLEPYRVNVRPEGLQIVLSDGPEDLQDAWLHADGRAFSLCNLSDASLLSSDPSSWRGQMSALEFTD